MSYIVIECPVVSFTTVASKNALFLAGRNGDEITGEMIIIN